MNDFIVYTLTFADGTKYFGNSHNKNRPYQYKAKRSKRFIKHFELYGEPETDVLDGLTLEEAERLEQQLFDQYVASGGVPIQNRPNCKDLVNAMKGAELDPVAREKYDKAMDARYPNRLAQKNKRGYLRGLRLLSKAFDEFDRAVQATKRSQKEQAKKAERMKALTSTCSTDVGKEIIRWLRHEMTYTFYHEASNLTVTTTPYLMVRQYGLKSNACYDMVRFGRVHKGWMRVG